MMEYINVDDMAYLKDSLLESIFQGLEYIIQYRSSKA